MSDRIPSGVRTLDDFLTRYAPDSALFIAEVFDIDLYPWQQQVCRWYDEGRRGISVASGHGVGKGWLLALLAIHHVLTRFPQKTICTAPSAGQLYQALWNDIKIFVNRLPPVLKETLEVRADSIHLADAPNESFIAARTSRADQPEAMQGIRSEGWTLVLGDEASGIPDTVFEAGRGSMSGFRVTTILTGNPIRTAGFFYDTHHRLKDRWATLNVSCRDIPHITPDYIEECKQLYGEDSARFAYRVLGQFPTADEETLIAAELVEGAKLRDVEPIAGAKVVWGLDVARSGADRSALAKRQANVLLEPVKTYTERDLMRLCGRIIAEFQATPRHQRPVELCIDVIGIGAGVVDRLREVGPDQLPGCAVRGINVAEAPPVAGPYVNLRSALWHEYRDWYAGRDVRIPDDERLIAQTVAAKAQFTSAGKIKMESKDDMKKRGLPSPDEADAVVLTFAATAARLSGGTLRGGSLRTALDSFVSPYV